MAGDPSWDIPCYWEPEAERISKKKKLIRRKYLYKYIQRMAQGMESTLSNIVNNGNYLKQNTHNVILEYLPFTWENRKLQLENQMVHAFLFQKPQKIWAVI